MIKHNKLRLAVIIKTVFFKVLEFQKLSESCIGIFFVLPACDLQKCYIHIVFWALMTPGANTSVDSGLALSEVTEALCDCLQQARLIISLSSYS